MTSLLAELSAIAGAAFAAEGIAPELGQVQVSDRPDLAEFQCNGALAAAKIAKTNPRAIAEKIAARLRESPLIGEAVIAGPGFINLKLAPEALEQRLQSLYATARWRAPGEREGQARHRRFRRPEHRQADACRTSCAPRSSATRCSGCSAPTVGRSSATCIWAIGACRWASSSPSSRCGGPSCRISIRRTGARIPKTRRSRWTIWRRSIRQAAAACKADPERLEAARLATAELQAGRPGYRALWQHFHDVSAVGLKREFASLGVVFDEWKGESDADPLIPDMIERLKEDRFAIMDEGALIVPVAENDRHQRSAAADPAEVRRRGALRHDRSRHHRRPRARARSRSHPLRRRSAPARAFRAGVPRGEEDGSRRAARELEHIGYGTVNGPDGKPFKTRAGGVMKLYDLIAMATEEATKRLNEQGLALDYPDDERAAIAKMVGVAAIKFADLVEQPGVELHLRSRTLHALRGQDRALSAIRGGAHPIDPAQGGSRRLRGRRTRHPLERGAAARAPASADARSAPERRSTSARRISSAITCSRWRRISAASTPSITS